MATPQNGAGKDHPRRKFLKGSLQALWVAPVSRAVAAPRAEGNEWVSHHEEGPLPGDPGYRDPIAYGSIAAPEE